MLMPILDITFSTPLPSALIRLYPAWSAVMPVRSPLSIRSMADSKARYGLTAAAP